MVVLKKYILYLLGFSVLIGFIITILSGFFSHSGYVGGAVWGFPFYWKLRILPAPPYVSDINILYDNFIYDVVIWTIIVFVLSLLIYKKYMIRFN